jgi:hypothetical protein
MSTAYAQNRQWSDQYIPAIKRIVGPYLVEESPLEIDRKQAADLITLRAKNLCIACRVRRNGYLPQYDNQFTLRCQLESGSTTEEEKIINGWGDWMFYGHAFPDDMDVKDFVRWFLIDLSAWRAHLILKGKRDKIRPERRGNGDGTYFRVYRIDQFEGDPPLLIAEG